MTPFGFSRELTAEGGCFFYPGLDRFAQFAQAAFEEVICTFDHYELLWFSGAHVQSFQLVRGPN